MRSAVWSCSWVPRCDRLLDALRFAFDERRAVSEALCDWSLKDSDLLLRGSESTRISSLVGCCSQGGRGPTRSIS